MKAKITAGAIGVYLAGSSWYLSVFRHEPGRFWGDAGDGFFNLWILNHIRLAFTNPNVSLIHPPIFWPKGDGAFFWSDNLLAIAPLYLLAEWVMPSRIDAFWLLGVLLSALHYAALCFLFYQLLAWIREHHPELSSRVLWWAPVLAGLTHFTPAVLINHFMHVQNFTSLGVFCLIGGMIRYERQPNPQRLWGIVLPLVFMLYCAPYFAIIGVVLTLAWAVHQTAAKPFLFSTHLWEARLMGLLCLVLVLPIAAAYLTHRHEGYLASDIATFAIHVSDLFIPQYGVTRDLMGSMWTDYPTAHHERIAWLGPGLLLGLAALIVCSWPLRKSISWRSVIRHPLTWIIIVSVLLLSIKVRELRPILSVYGVIFVGSLLTYYLIVTARVFRDRPVARMAAFLIFCVICLYGLALGPLLYYQSEAVNPSIWGFFALWFPGFTSMRAIGRIAYLGHVTLVASFTLAAIIYYANRSTTWRRPLLFFFVLLALIQALDTIHVRPPEEILSSDLIEPRADERAFFFTIEGPVVVLPSQPFPRSARYMLYFQSFPQIQLMNGYSGRSTPTWNAIMQKERDYGLASDQQLREIQNNNPDYLVIHTHQQDPVTSSYILRFQNERWQVYEMTKSNH